MKTLIRNQIKTPDGTILRSYSRHDYKEYRDKNGYIYMVDGGLSYLRRIVVREHPYEEQSLYLEDFSFVEARDIVLWGTYGIEGPAVNDIKYVPIAELGIKHIESILETQKQISVWLRILMLEELIYREGKNNNGTKDTSSSSTK